MDLSILQDFQINTNPDWSTWQFHNQEYKDFPLSFFNKFGKAIKFCDLSTIAPNKDDADFVVVEGNTKTKNKQYISRTITMGDKKKTGQSWSKIFTKKQKKNYRAYTNQFKTKFRQITVKNDWILLKAINKRNLDEAPQVENVKVQVLKQIGKLRYLNQKVQKINWNPTGFKQNQAYHVDSISTMNDKYLAEEIGANLFDQEQSLRRPSIVCSLQFLLAIMTARGGQYPWTISVSKAEHVLVLDRYSTTQDANFSYLDLFTPNQNTSGNMARDESKVRDNCVNGTKMTKIFQDLLASGDLQQTKLQEVEENQGQKEEQQGQNKIEQGQNEDQDLEQIKKYIKIAVDNIDIFTSVKVNGLKKRSNGDEQPCLIRTFVQTGTDGGWIQDIKKSQGTLVFQQYLANSCSLQKWICQANLAGVDLIKFGFIGFSKQKPLIVNVQETTIKNLQKFISFKYMDCYSILKYIVNQMSSYEDGQYVLSRNAYSPLSLKLYKLPVKQEEEQEQN